MGKVYSMVIKYLDSKRIVGLSQSSIAHDTTSSTESSGSVSSLTHSMTVADNSNRVLIACVSSYGSSPTITGVTWNGDTMTAVPNSESYQAGSNNRTQIYYIISPDTGSHNIVASFSGSATCGIGGMSFYNVDQTTPVGAGNTSSATATATSSLALTPTVTGSWIIAMISSSSSVGTATGLTQSYALNANALVRGGRNESPTIGSANTVGWGSSSSSHAMSGCAIIPYGDAKPTNVQDNSILVEKDTANRYWFDLAGDYKVHKFTTTGASTFEVTAGSGDIEYLVVAGGGGGGYAGAANAGGGGAGGYKTATGYAVTAQNYAITVGSGGAFLPSGATSGTAGGDSSIVPTSGTTITSDGGGYGGNASTGGGNGGSGGGTAQSLNGQYGTGIAGQGYRGGDSTIGGKWGGGGGGGASQVGFDSSGSNSRIGGNGGNGFQNDITGTNIYYAGGGGGSSHGSATEAQPQGGLGGGGLGSKNLIVGSNGTDGLGGGGGGGSSSGWTTGGTGGSGIVIIRYLNDGSITATGGDSVTNTPPATWTKQVSSTPPTVAGLTLHLDSSDASTITKDGSNLVSAWNDKSGQANHITQATGSKQPLWVDRVQDTLPIIRFDGTDDFLKIASWSGGALATSTSYMVFNPTSSGSTWFDSAINRTVWLMNSGTNAFQMYSGTNMQSTATVVIDEWIYCQIVSAGASSIIRRDGITIATGDTGSQSFNGIYLGSGQNTAYSPIDVAELLVYEGTHSTSDRDVIEAYLKKKWGL